MESITLSLFDDSFNALLQEVSGKIRLDSEDPKWQLFFRNKSVIYLQGKEVEWRSFFELLIMNNPYSGNLLMIFEQTTSRIQQVINKKSKPSLLLLEQCCSALHVATLVIHYICSHLKIHEIRKQLGLPQDWPNYHHEKFQIQAHNNSEITLKSIFEAVFIIVQMNPVQPWLYDLSFFSANFLLTSFTCQLYGTDQTLSMSANQENYYFLNYIYNISSVQLRAAMARADGDISSTLATKLTRALLVHTVDKMPAPSNSLCSLLIRQHTTTTSTYQNENQSTSNFLMDTLSLSTQLPYHTYHTLGSLLQFPMSAWQTMISYLQLPFPSFLSKQLRLARNQQPLPRYIQDDSNSNSYSNTTVNNTTRIADTISTHSNSGGTSLNTQIQNNNNNTSNTSSSNSNLMDNSSLNNNIILSYEESSSSTARNAKLKLSDTPLSERSCILLLILLNNRRSIGLPNPFREVFHLLNDEMMMMVMTGSDGEDGNQNQGVDMEMMLGNSRPVILTAIGHTSQEGFGGSMMSSHSSSSSGCDHLSFPVLVDHLVKGLLVDTSRECTSLLLYSYLQSHPHFLEAVLATSSVHGPEAVTSLIASLLRALYLSTVSPSTSTMATTATTTTTTTTTNMMFHLQSNRDHVYVLLSNLLMVAQDPLLRRMLFNHPIPSELLGWYTERSLSKTSLGDMIVLILLRTALQALFRVKDVYLLTNCLAGLQSLAGIASHISHYVAERLITVTLQLAKRYITHRDRDMSTVAEGISSGGSDGDGLMVEELEDMLRTLLSFIWIALRPQRRIDNVLLLYALLLLDNNHKVVAILQHPYISSLSSTLDPLESVSVNPHASSTTSTPTVTLLPSSASQSSIASTTPIKANGSQLSSRKHSLASSQNVVSNSSTSNTTSVNNLTTISSSTLPTSLPVDLIQLITWCWEMLEEEDDEDDEDDHHQVREEEDGFKYSEGNENKTSTNLLPHLISNRTQSLKQRQPIPTSSQDVVSLLTAHIQQKLHGSRRPQGSRGKSTWMGGVEWTVASTSITGTTARDGVEDQEEDDSNGAGGMGLVYLYEEGGCPEAFFVPYVWEVAIRTFPDMGYFHEKISLLD